MFNEFYIFSLIRMSMGKILAIKHEYKKKLFLSNTLAYCINTNILI